MGGLLLGWRTVCAVELDAYCRSVLLARQRDGILAPFALWDDVRTFDGQPWRGRVDVVSGGFPCQDISAAGGGAGIDGAKSGLWVEMARIIREVRPRYAFVENSPMLASRGLGRVLGDLAAMGFDARWGVFSAAEVGAPHLRERLFILAADSHGPRELQPEGRESASGRRPSDGTESATNPARNGRRSRGPRRPVASRAGEGEFALPPLPDADRSGRERRAGAGGDERGLAEPADAATDVDSAGRSEQRRTVAVGEEQPAAECEGWWASEPDVVRMVHGIPSRVDRIRGLGNAQVPAVVVRAWRTLTAPSRLEDGTAMTGAWCEVER